MASRVLGLLLFIQFVLTPGIEVYAINSLPALVKSTLHDVNYGGVVLSHGRILTVGTKSAIHYTDKKSIKVHLNGFSEGFDVVEVFPTEPLGMLLALAGDGLFHGDILIGIRSHSSTGPEKLAIFTTLSKWKSIINSKFVGVLSNSL